MGSSLDVTSLSFLNSENSAWRLNGEARLGNISETTRALRCLERDEHTSSLNEKALQPHGQEEDTWGTEVHLAHLPLEGCDQLCA